ncbi:mannitol dehydrogenase family protein [Roseibium denhamense]|uniref:Mannitol 2-dehydrogenase n=1 Tax=Roseibium denhamense TaxID=76305 RepID=A0ABY1PJ63_9HYPH|nr:mannitol dehydrogenase family protein [Roseibium denhamense]MTI05865.1 mannitol dehydrogenase family protein [Roseibium denhamense]SMP35531.1 mannitol 2-dehydrogenase [Roseibium denhamense]
MDELIPLSNTNLGRLPSTVRAPQYDRTKLTPGIIHIGLGNFHRAHQAWYLHRLFDAGLNHDWAILGAGVRSYDKDQRDKLLAQDCLTTLIELAPARSSAEIIGSMIDYIPIENGNTALIERMADPAIRIVSLTVTEGGYYIDPVTKAFDQTHPDIEHDAKNPDRPLTVFGALVAALARRKASGSGPFTGLSCDNLQGNGHILQQAVVSLASMSNPALARWIEEECSFPNSMVDCIVPATGMKEIDLARSFGVDDAAPVTHEPFRQWVIEDDFCAGRPDWEKCGATFTGNVQTHETMKIRVLNAGHQLLANAGEILSIETISEAMAHPLIGAFFRKTAIQEIAPHVAPVPEMTAEAYIDLIAARFANPAIIDTTRRVAFDGSSRHTGFLLPTLREALAADTPVDGLALAEAIWARMCYGIREDGSVISPNDPNWDALKNAAIQAKSDPAVWLAQHNIYGRLANDLRFKTVFERRLRQIWREGLEAALKDYLVSEATAYRASHGMDARLS